MKQEVTGWQWHQGDHLQITCTSLQTDSHASTSSQTDKHASTSLIRCPSWRSTNSVKAVKIHLL